VVAQRARSGEFHSVEFNIQREGFSFEPFREAIHVTQILLDLFKQEMGSTSLVLMLVDDIEPYSTALKDVSRKLDIPLVIPARAAPLSPSDRLPDGTHLNEKGNEHVGRAFIELASKRGSLPELE
jgi:hypothetical protein